MATGYSSLRGTWWGRTSITPDSLPSRGRARSRVGTARSTTRSSEATSRNLFYFLVERKSGTGQALDQFDGKVDGRTTLRIVRVCI